MEPTLRQNGLPTVRPSVVALFDVLGFSDSIRHAQANGTSNEMLRQFAATVSNWYPVIRDTLAAEDGSARLRETRAFSDNVVIGQPIRWRGEPELGYMMSDLAYLQLGLILDGFFLRGGIAAGELYMDEDLVFGVGILGAAEAEKVAGTPRVLLHDTAVTLAREQVRYYTSISSTPHDEALYIDEDGRVFLNCLDAAWPDRTEYPDLSALQRHRDHRASAARGISRLVTGTRQV